MSEGIVQESSSPPSDSGPEPQESAEAAPSEGGLGSAGEVTPAAQARIQELVRQRKQVEAELSQSRQKEAQYQAYIQRVTQYQQQQKQQQQPQRPDAETELIVKDLGGDETAQKLYEVLGRRFDVAAKNSGFVTAEQAQQLVQ